MMAPHEVAGRIVATPSRRRCLGNTEEAREVAGHAQRDGTTAAWFRRMGRGKGRGWTALGQVELRRPPQAKKMMGHGRDAGAGWARRERRDIGDMVEEDVKERIWTAPGQVELCRTPQSKKMTRLVQWKGRRLMPRALPGWEKAGRGRSTPRAHSCSSRCRGTPESNAPSLCNLVQILLVNNRFRFLLHAALALSTRSAERQSTCSVKCQ